MMKPSEVLRAARKLIERPENWGRGALALTANGVVTGVNSEHAKRFCMAGACRAVSSRCDITVDPNVRLLREATGNYLIGDWNDAEARTHEDVMAAFDRAIALAEAEEHPASELERGRARAVTPHPLQPEKKGT